MAVDANNSLMVYFLVYSIRVLKILEQAIAVAKEEQKEKVAVISLPVLGAFPDLELLQKAKALNDLFYVNDPGRNMEMLCMGVEVKHTFAGEDALIQAQQAFLADTAAQTGETTVSPVFYGGFAFAPGAKREGMWAEWPDGLWIWPRWQWIKEGGQIYLVVSHKVTGDSDPETIYRELQEDLRAVTEAEVTDIAPTTVGLPELYEDEPTDPDRWKRAVQQTVNDIRSGTFEKVVLARKTVLRSQQEFDTVRALTILKENNPTSVAFYLRHGQQVFLGATPERLVESYKGQVLIDCLAGTAPRGTNEEEDARLGQELLASDKNRIEHQLVRSGIESALGDAVNLLPTSGPTLRKLTHVQHLYTPLRGDMKEGDSLLGLVEKLHPTPAVAGVPRDLVKPVITEREAMDRGFYAGPIGWMDREGNGTFVVALRSGVVEGNRAEIFAGGGIVADSEPDLEWQEAEWKFAPMKTALGLLAR